MSNQSGSVVKTINLDLPENLESILHIQQSFTLRLSKEQRDNMMLCIITTKSPRSCRKQIIRLRRQDRKIYGVATAKLYASQTIVYSVDNRISFAEDFVQVLSERLRSEQWQLPAMMILGANTGTSINRIDLESL